MTIASTRYRSTEAVVLLHGLGRTKRSMGVLAKALRGEGYVVLNLDYPSRRFRIEDLADGVLDEAVRGLRIEPPARVHFVTHSMGGIVVRYYLKHHRPTALGRVVMLSPPNQGSELVDRLKDLHVFRSIHGPAGQQLNASANEFLDRLGVVDFELGIITGRTRLDPLAARLIPGPNDGKVSVERAKVRGMKDFLVLPHHHTFIMRRRAVIDQVVHFLRCGVFSVPDPPSAERAHRP